MAHAVTVQTEQKLPLVQAQPDFTELSPEILVQILKRIFGPDDVAKLNLVSKRMLQLNQNLFVALPRIQVLEYINSYVVQKFGVHSLKNYSYPLPDAVFDCKNINNYEKYIAEAQKVKRAVPFLWIWGGLSWFEREDLKGKILIANDQNDDGLGMQFGEAALNIATQRRFIGHPDRAKYQCLSIMVFTDHISDLKKSN